MSAKTYCKKTAAFAGWLIQNVPADLDEETMDNWMNNPNGTKKFLSGLKPPKPTKPVPLFSVVEMIRLGAVAGKLTKQCFTGDRYAYRDSDFDNWLPANQPNADACVITTLAPSRGWTFAKAAATVLGVSANMPVKTLGELLIKHGHTITLSQDEEMVEKTERGANTGMRTDGWGNFAFVETGDPENPVSVGDVYRDGRDWGASVSRLGDDDCCYADFCLLVRNLDTSKL